MSEFYVSKNVTNYVEKNMKLFIGSRTETAISSSHDIYDNE